MKSDALFQDLKKHSNIKIFENIDKSIKKFFRIKFNNFQDKLFFEVIENCGGIIIDNWIRLYGCGELNVISKNELILENSTLDILIGEDVLGGIFGLKDNVVYYFAPDLLEWECLNVYYANFMNWLINDSQNVNLFYKKYRWNNWEEESSKLLLTQGFSFYPFLCSKCPIENRSRKIISMNEIIKLNFNLKKQIN